MNEWGGHRIHWNQGTDADAQVAAAVDDLLSTALTADSTVQIALLNNPSLQPILQRRGQKVGRLAVEGMESRGHDALAPIRSGVSTTYASLGVAQAELVQATESTEASHQLPSGFMRRATSRTWSSFKAAAWRARRA